MKPARDRPTHGAHRGGSLPSMSPESSQESGRRPSARTVLGPVEPARLGVTLMHEHAPLIDWSELYETPPAPVAPARERILDTAAGLLDAFAAAIGDGGGPGTLVEATPIRVGRYPDLMVDLSRRTGVHIVAATGFWTEALAPHHPWALRLCLEPDGPSRMTELFVREITEGMEDPGGAWGERFTEVRAGIIKLGTSSFMTPLERTIHRAAADASRETGCPITTHTNHGGGLEQAQLLLAAGVPADKIIIGHQGYLDDREQEEAHEYHEEIARLGCFVQFDRVAHADYTVDGQARQIAHLVDAGFGDQILVSHDMAAFAVTAFTAQQKPEDAWEELGADFTVVPTKLVPALRSAGVSDDVIHGILEANPQRALAF